MTWPFDPLQPIAPEEPDNQAPPDEDQSQPVAGQESQKRTDVDDVLDAVAGQRQSAAKRDFSKCPNCTAPMKRRGGGIGISVVTMRCTNRACRLEIPVASIRTRIDVPPPPPNPVLLGGPYRGNPDRGGGAPPIDPHEPINRRLSELMRRMSENE